MLASLLAASLASNLGLEGCALSVALLNAGFAIPSGSNSSECPFGADVCNGDSADAADIDCASGCGAAVDAECRGEDTARLAGPGTEVEEGANVDDVGFTNMDFVPSTKRPPNGGTSLTGADAGDGCVCESGDDGPAPGDCRGLFIADDGSAGVYRCCETAGPGEAGRADNGPAIEGVVDGTRIVFKGGALAKGAGTGALEISSNGGT